MSNLFGYTIFCDDIRQEVGGKTSLMGRYIGSMNIGAPPPAEGEAFALPRLAASVNFVGPKDIAASQLRVVLLLQRDGHEPMTLSEAISDIPAERSGDGEIMSATFNFMVSPLVLPGPCLIRARGYFDEIEVKAGSLQVAFTPDLVV